MALPDAARVRGGLAVTDQDHLLLRASGGHIRKVIVYRGVVRQTPSGMEATVLKSPEAQVLMRGDLCVCSGSVASVKRSEGGR